MQRSGTTWLTRWLEERPDVFAVHESYLIQSGIDMLEHLPRGGRLVSKAHLRAFLDDVYGSAAGERACVVDKSPGALIHRDVSVVDTIFDLFPDAHVIGSYRDGKNFVYGHLHLPWTSRVGWDVEKATNFWIEQIQLLRRLPHHPQTMVVRYEDLMTRPERSREIAAFLGLSAHGDIQPWARPVNTIHQEPDLERWKTLDRDSLSVMKRMNPYLLECGYEPV